ncbi:hypothetical protein ACEPAH_1618 [Sanghuangporus vaninii]
MATATVQIAHDVSTSPTPRSSMTIAGTKATVGLDRTDFEFVDHKSTETEFLDEKRIKAVYYNEVEELRKKVAGGKREFVLDHTIKRNYGHGDNVDLQTPFSACTRTSPAKRLSIACTNKMGAEAERLFKGCVRIINVWRTIRHPTPGEVTLIKCFDSNKDKDKERLTPHSAFVDSTESADVPQRQSIELVFLYLE